MSTDVVKYAFIAGEISPTLYGRTDLTKYDLAMAEARNWFVDYRGGLSTRPGTEFCDFIWGDVNEIRIEPFSFGPDLEDNYLMVFGGLYVRFMQEGAYVLESSKTITNIEFEITTLKVTTSGAHGYSNNDWVQITGVNNMPELEGRSFQIIVASSTTFYINSLPAFISPSFDPDYISGGTVSRIYTVTHPWQAHELAELNFSQYRDLVRITHPAYHPRDLRRNDHASWTLSLSDVRGAAGAGVTISSTATSAAGTASTIFGVTYILSDGTESAIGHLAYLTSIVNYPVTAGNVTISWAQVAGAVGYNVYRSVVVPNGVLDAGAELGYVGRVTGGTFVDPNIVPDFTKKPPEIYTPFSPGSIESITVTNGGTGWVAFSTFVSASGGGGSGFVGKVIVDSSGVIIKVEVVDPGTGYSANPTISFTGAGSGATATATVKGSTGIYPALSTVFQQRQIYAASFNDPVRIWGSQIKRFNSFNSGSPPIDSDAYEFDLDTASIAPIKHLINVRGGLLAMTQEDLWLLSGGSNNEPVTPSNALAEPQSYTGVSDVRPIFVGTDLLYSEGKGYSVRLLRYNEITKVYGGEDRSIISNHLFGKGKEIVAWAHQESPNKIVWAVREDGVLLAFTIVQEEEVFAWTPCTTRGKFLDVAVVRENKQDVVYVVVERVNENYRGADLGLRSKFIERLVPHEFVNVEDCWAVDSGLTTQAFYPNATLGLFLVSGTLLESSEDIFNDYEVGDFVRAGNGVFKITSIQTNKRAIADTIIPATNLIPETNDEEYFLIPSGSWSISKPVTSLSGLWHLEGQTVNALADGNVVTGLEVVNGTIELPAAASKVTAGLPYTCRARTLPTIVPNAGIEGRRKRISGLAVRMDQSRGLKAGQHLDELYPVRERTTESHGTPTTLINGIKYINLKGQWDEDAQVYFVVDEPLPVTLLSLALDLEVGDEKD